MERRGAEEAVGRRSSTDTEVDDVGGRKTNEAAAGFSPWGLLALLAAGAVAATVAVGLLSNGDRESASPDARMEVSNVLGGGDSAGYARAVDPRTFDFPADHGPHPGFRTEWWYLTGNLETESGRRFGYQFTLFRIALAPEPPESPSDWSTNQAFMAHFAVTDPESGRFRTAERFARGALGLAGARSRPFRVWLEDWSLGAVAEAPFPARLRVAADSAAVDLRLERGKPPVLQGDNGLSPKGPGRGNASYYYSLPRMSTTGRLVAGTDTFQVSGLSWMDREWSTSALGPGMEGWDWFALQLEGGGELMYYRLRRDDGTPAPESRGSLVEPDGSVRTLDRDDVRLRPRRWWESPDGGVRYPVSWSLEVPSEGLALTLDPLLRDQEWRGAVRYWEGAVEARGSRGDEPVRGRGYVELTGYGGSAPPGGG